MIISNDQVMARQYVKCAYGNPFVLHDLIDGGSLLTVCLQ